MKDTPSHGEKLSYYDFGATTYYALERDPRFPYCLYVPRGYDEAAHTRHDLLVVVHGSARTPERYRELFAPFCAARGVIALFPLFPNNIDGDAGGDAYKYLEWRGTRYDEVLLGMAAEVGERYRLHDERFLLHGFSGGGHFAHRFAYLHPGRLRAVSVGAPGVVTLLDEGTPWWRGVGDLKQRFGREVDLPALRRVPVQMLVGERDTDTWEITMDETNPRWMPGANDAGVTRIERLRSLRASFEDAGVAVRFETVPGVAHEGYRMIDAVTGFFAEVLQGAEVRA